MNHISNENFSDKESESSVKKKKRPYRYKTSIASVKKVATLTPEEQEKLELVRLQSKRIRYLNPMKFYVTADVNTLHL